MQTTSPTDDFQQQVLAELSQISQRLDRLGADVADVDQRLDRLEADVEKLDYKFDTYQKGSDQVVRLATTIIIAAASVVILSPVLQAVVPVVNTLFSGQSAP